MKNKWHVSVLILATAFISYQIGVNTNTNNRLPETEEEAVSDATPAQAVKGEVDAEMAFVRNLDLLTREYFFTGACLRLAEESLSETTQSIDVYDLAVDTNVTLTPIAQDLLRRVYAGHISSLDDLTFHMAMNTQNLSNTEVRYIYAKLGELVDSTVLN